MSIHKRSQARHDIVDLADYLDQINQNLSDRFLDAVERTLKDLEGMPGMGSPFPLTNPRLQETRAHPVQGFPNHLIFYLPQSGGIEIVRVLYGKRNIINILEMES